jgi:molybdopterin synthase catalytic subunit
MELIDTTRYCAIVDVDDGALDPAAALEFVDDPGFGGVAVFVGRVRDRNHGRDVLGISYDLFDPLALAIFARAAAEAEAACGAPLRTYVAHAKGRLDIGGLAVVVAVGSAHRDAAFRGCRALIEAVKHRAPIWKREHYADGDSAWSEGCSLCDAEAVPDGEGAHVHLPAPAAVAANAAVAPR